MGNSIHTNGADASDYWDKQWLCDEVRKEWLDPEDQVACILPLLKQAQVKYVLDLGCGVGRNALYLAEKKFQVVALDGSAAGLSYAQKRADDLKLEIEFIHGKLDNINLPSASIDYILAWNVIYHGTFEQVLRIVQEIDRILIPNGLFQGTLISKKNVKFGKGREIAKNTFVIDEESDKQHPHCYFDQADAKKLFKGFQIVRLEHVEFQTPGSYHWHYVIKKNNRNTAAIAQDLKQLWNFG